MEKRIEELEECDWCGRDYDSNCEGHEHFKDGGCECKYCETLPEIKGKKFCSQECECKFLGTVL